MERRFVVMEGGMVVGWWRSGFVPHCRIQLGMIR